MFGGGEVIAERKFMFQAQRLMSHFKGQEGTTP